MKFANHDVGQLGMALNSSLAGVAVDHEMTPFTIAQSAQLLEENGKVGMVSRLAGIGNGS